MSVSATDRDRGRAVPPVANENQNQNENGRGTTPQPQESPEALKARQIAQAEELLFSGPSKEGFAKALYKGEFRARSLFPYPTLNPDDDDRVRQALDELRRFADEAIDPAAIDRDADIPPEVVRGLGRLGVLGMTAPPEYGGLGFGQPMYCRVMEEIGARCASTAVFVNAHHSIGIRALLLFGTPEQRARWLPDLVSGRKLAAFALTEEQAGSDASNVQTTATPSPDGSSYRLNGSKRYITNGGIADVLTVMARTPDPKGGESRVTAFLVTPDMPGFRVLEARKPKCGIRGTATGALAFENMDVPASNILGPLGKGLRVALTVLDFGRTTFGASCAGAAKFCLRAAVAHANRRRQFGRALGEIDLVRKKIARIAAFTYAMEAATIETAALIDSGAEDYMLETAILKVFATEALWEIVYETLQIHGGQGYFDDEPFERMTRDARINTIGEGANEVLKSFIALVGARDVGKRFEAVLNNLKSLSSFAPTLWSFGGEQLKLAAVTPTIPVRSPELRPAARSLARRVRRFAWAVERALVKYREGFLERQLPQERIADAAISLFTASCVLARLDHELQTQTAPEWGRAAANLYLKIANRRFDEALRALADHDDDLTLQTAEITLRANDLP